MERNPTVLVVEDDDALRMLLTRSIRRANIPVLSAATAEEAYTLFLDHEGDVVLVVLDLVLPGMGGEGLFYAIREKSPDIWVLAMSGHDLETIGESLLENGAISFVRKPVDLSVIEGECRKAVGRYITQED